LNVSLPNGEGLSVSFSEMTGNVFEYDFEGELYSGMMYQADQSSYIVTLTNGPLEGTRLKFNGELSLEDQIQAEESQRSLAETQEAGAGVNDGPTEVAQTPAQSVEQNPGLESAVAEIPHDNYQTADVMAQQQAVEQAGEQFTYQMEPQNHQYQNPDPSEGQNPPSTY
jgi:hypothetical protein